MSAAGRTRLVLVGGGGHCLACIAAIETNRAYEIVGVVDDRLLVENEKRLPDEQVAVAGYPVLGGDADLERLPGEHGARALITVGQIESAELRARLFASLPERVAVVIAGNASVARTARIGQGTIVMQQAIVNADASVGQNCIINNQALVEHGVVVGDHSHISTGALVNGDCRIGQRVFIGSGAVLKQGVSIHDEVRVGAGAVVLGDLHEPGWYAGNPAVAMRESH